MYDRKLNMLYAYPYFDQRALDEFAKVDRSKFRLIIDSGAFSAHNSGFKITLDEYNNFLRSIEWLKPDAAVQLDVVFQPEETKRNFFLSREQGINVCPVFTRGDKEDYLQDLIDRGEYVFIGGVQGGQGAKEFAKYILNRYADKKIHYLAFVRPDWLIHYKPYSTDSSSWSSAVRFGEIQVFKNGFLKRYNKMYFQKRPTDDDIALFSSIGISYRMLQKLAKAESWITRRFSPEQLHDNTPHCDNLHGFISMCSWIKYSVEYQNKVGTKIYLAISSEWQLRSLIAAYDHLVSVGVI